MTRPRKSRAFRGFFVAENGRAPRGWVEIQRDALAVLDGGPVYDSDNDAVLAVEKHARCPGVAMLYCDAAQAFVRPLMSGGPQIDTLVETLINGCNVVRDAPAPRWIAVVPAFVARKAGLRFSKEAIGT